MHLLNALRMNTLPTLPTEMIACINEIEWMCQKLRPPYRALSANTNTFNSIDEMLLSLEEISRAINRVSNNCKFNNHKMSIVKKMHIKIMQLVKMGEGKVKLLNFNYSIQSI